MAPEMLLANRLVKSLGLPPLTAVNRSWYV